jgi:hypothetical protein
MKANIAPVRSIFFTTRLPASLIKLSCAVASSQSIACSRRLPCTPHKVIGLTHSGKQIGGTRVEVLRNTVPPELHRLPEPVFLRSFKRIVRAPRIGEVA